MLTVKLITLLGGADGRINGEIAIKSKLWGSDGRQDLDGGGDCSLAIKRKDQGSNDVHQSSNNYAELFDG